MRSLVVAAALAAIVSTPVRAQDTCSNFGPQTPRDISSRAGTNPLVFALAPAPASMNLCNIHFHKNAEHKGPGFSVVAAAHGEHGGFQCNQTAKLTPAELTAPEGGACKEIKPGDTIEVHWVYSSCGVAPGKGLGACLSERCSNPTLRVESQVFLVVNSKTALDFTKFDYSGAAAKNGLHQARALPAATGKPVVFRGSTTGPQYDDRKCSPMQATWSVRPQCAKVDIGSLNKWCEHNAFHEEHAHGVRPIVTAPQLLDRIQ